MIFDSSQRERGCRLPRFSPMRPFGFELFELTLLPGYQRESEPHEPGVTEHVIVISGVMEVLVDGAWRSPRSGVRPSDLQRTVPMAIAILGSLPPSSTIPIHYPAMAAR